MTAQRYDIYFSGNTLEDTDLATVKEKIAKIFNANEEQLDYLFSGASVKIKNNVDQDTAVKYRVAFRDAGALVEIRSADPIEANQATIKKQAPGSPDVPATGSDDTDTMSLLPANTGSLADCAPVITPASLPNIDNLSLATPGTVLDETESPEPLQIDTSELTLAPANSGTLEDCQSPKEPVPIPDISQLRIVEPDD
ncbi:MAG: hypothetical protein OQL20_07125 [Sedimenticola sp.]|nr:hypothetical protein [Sedimenticola sp.]